MAEYFQKAFLGKFSALFFVWAFLFINVQGQSVSTYDKIRKEFLSPDYARWGEVPLWWWEADSLSKDRISWELEKLAGKGVKAVCPIQRSPARTYPESFSEKWWEMVEYAHKECERLGMQLWIYDQVGYGQYGWLEKAAAKVENTGTSRIEFLSMDANPNKNIRMQLPEGKLLGARAYPIRKDTARDENSIDLTKYVNNNALEWKPEQGKWKVAVSVAVPYRSFYMNQASTKVFLNQLYQKIEDVAGQKAMGKSLAGVFQDEHPPTPRNIYSQQLADTFEEMFGYDIERAIPALHFDVGAKTPKYRLNYFDAYLSMVEKTYWEKIYNWTAKRNLLTSHDNWGRNNIYRQSEGYIDYFRTQRWFSAPGLDDSHQRPLEERNYYDTKIASSIARLYDRPRVWAEAFHSSGWGRTTNQTLSWLSALYAFGANLYDEHGLYYSLNASTWEHAAPDPHWRQPYWTYYQEISDWVARTSYLMSQGNQVADVAVHYPVVSLLSEVKKSRIDYNDYMELSRIIYNDGIDNDIIDDQSILNATVQNGSIRIRGNAYQALVFGPEATIRLSVLKKALELAEDGGTVLFFGQLPTSTVEKGRHDQELAAVLEKFLDVSLLETESPSITKHNFTSGGFGAFIPHTPELLPSLLSAHIDRDFIARGGDVFISHRRIENMDVYLIQNTEDRPIELNARFRVDGVPEIWDPFIGEIKEVNEFDRINNYTRTTLTLEGNVAKLLVFKPGSSGTQRTNKSPSGWEKKQISRNWKFAVIPTRDNRWGDFRWPPSKKKIGPEVRQFKYKEETGIAGSKLGWDRPGFDDSNWDKFLYNTGPYWLALKGIPENSQVIRHILPDLKKIKTGNKVVVDGTRYSWREISFSKKIGLGKPVPWGGHSLYPDGHFDKNFIQLEEGRKLLFTRIYSAKTQRVGLNVQLRNSEPKLWVNGKEESFQGSIGNLPLKKGYNYILLDVPDGTGGMLYVQKEPPSVRNLGKEDTNSIYPDLNDASWIWFGNSDGTYLRKSFEINELPETAHLIVTGVTGFKLFINGKKVEEEIGPWANWDYPESINIKPYLKQGKNTFAAWGQFYKAQHYFTSLSGEYKGLALAMKVIFNDGSTMKLDTDNSWKGHSEEFNNWESPDFNDSGWEQATVKGGVGDRPWGEEFLQNVGSSTTPYRPLSVNLSSPYIQVFNDMPDIVYDIKPKEAVRIGWYRFEAPPGLQEIILNTDAEAQVWINGTEVPVSKSAVKIKNSPTHVSTIAIRLQMKRGEYAGAAFNLPIELKLEGGTIQPGSWDNYALPTYSGIGVYKQRVNFTKEETHGSIELDLGVVYVAAEVFVNGESAGVRVAKPFKFNLSEFVKPGENNIEVRVANTLAPHYSMPEKALHLGPTTSGLLGPVSLKISSK